LKVGGRLRYCTCRTRAGLSALACGPRTWNPPMTQIISNPTRDAHIAVAGCAAANAAIRSGRCRDANRTGFYRCSFAAACMEGYHRSVRTATSSRRPGTSGKQKDKNLVAQDLLSCLCLGSTRRVDLLREPVGRFPGAKARPAARCEMWPMRNTRTSPALLAARPML